MRLTWNGTDITDYCNIAGCVYRDAAGGRSDLLELKMNNASTWYRWGPEEGDEVAVFDGTYTTGKLYLTAVIPERNKYRILASSMKPAANRKAWAGFTDFSFRALIERCAAECGMTAKIFGTEENLLIPYAMRKGEGCGAFIDRIARAEGFRIKAYDGAIRAISLAYAEGMNPANRITLTDQQDGVTYRRRGNLKYTTLTVQSPWAQASATDTAAEGNNPRTVTTLPARDGAIAGRWARNLLKDHNRKAEELTVEQRLNTTLSALSRVSVDGGTDMDGEWIVEEAEHDLVNRTTMAKMYRVIDTIR